MRDKTSGLPRRLLLQGTGLAGAGLLLPPQRSRPSRSSPARPPPAAGVPPKGQIILGISQEPTVFNPLKAHIEVDEGVYMSLFSPLWSIDPHGDFQPQLAAEIPSYANGGLSEDGLTWRIKLRSGVTWHDGAPFTAEDVKYTIELINNPNFPTMTRSGHRLVRDLQVVSPTEITWRMESPYAPYLSVLAATFMVPQHILGKETDLVNAPFNNSPIGTGPFKWVERVPGDHITLAANEKFFGQVPYVARIIYKYVPDLTVLKTQFQTGDIDYIGLQGITADHYAEAKTFPGRRVVAAPLGFVEAIVFNNERPYFKDKAVRQALYLAMDKKSIVQDIYYGLPRPTESYLPQESWAYNPGLPVQSYDPDQARKLLDAAGWKPGSGGVREKDGMRLAFTNSTTAGNHVREQSQQVLQQNWQEIGVEMTIKNLPPAVMWGEYWYKDLFDTGMAGTVYGIGADPDVSDRLASASIAVKTGAGSNTAQFSNAAVDGLLHHATATLDRDARKQDYFKVQAIVRDELPVLPIFQWVMVEGTKDTLYGYQPNVNVRSNCWNVNRWYWA